MKSWNSQVCTSIVAEDPQGQIYAARNLDFGLFLGWDNSNDTWLMTERLRKVVRNVDFQRDGKTVFQSASFLGYVGLMTAVKPPLFALTINDRFNKEGGFVGIYQVSIKKCQGKQQLHLLPNYICCLSSNFFDVLFEYEKQPPSVDNGWS